ncbi:hypothetical protein FB45DRAFT_868313 [Roridomyces roridus]|uniref:Uncharacterized protein n=1 Tax=Roridomyces roridus TaxID=1738132 RepID=A0AAD7BQH1_9AGAR|nr:hypothetical protein FB45DRAFT_868313 [Roridomyces roridus]
MEPFVADGRHVPKREFDPPAGLDKLQKASAERKFYKCYPLWIITLWSRFNRVRDSQNLWSSAVDQVHETLEKSTTTEGVAKRAKAALKALQDLQWDGEPQGFKAGGSMEDLTLWLMKAWLKMDHKDQMLSYLGLSNASTSTIQATYFVVARTSLPLVAVTYRSCRASEASKGDQITGGRVQAVNFHLEQTRNGNRVRKLLM